MEVILGWPNPTTVNEVRSLLGLVGLQENCEEILQNSSSFDKANSEECQV